MLETTPMELEHAPTPFAPEQPFATRRVSPPTEFFPSGYLGPATVLETRDAEQLLFLQFKHNGEERRAWARLALAAPAGLRVGDSALVISRDLQDFYIIGVLASTGMEPRSAPAHTKTPIDTVRVCSRSGALIFEHEPESGKTRVNVSSGDLEFVTEQGSISFQSAREIRFGAASIKMAARRMETVVETVVAKAKNVFRIVEELTQLQTGRMRTLVKATCHFKARNASFKAEEDFKVDGEKIHLG